MNVFLFKSSVAAVLGGIATLIGGFDGLFQCFIILMAIDLVTGICAAWKENTLNSTKGWQGSVRKVINILVIVTATEMDRITGNNGMLRNATLLYFISNEGLSILENAGRLGVPLPNQLKNALTLLQKKQN